MIRLLMIFVAVSLFAGCKDTPTTASVSGVVTAYGEPVSGATVLFVPLTTKDSTGKELKISHGVTDDEGRYQLSMAGGRTKASLGRHQVLISKIEPVLKFPIDTKRDVEQESQSEGAGSEDQAAKKPVATLSNLIRGLALAPVNKRGRILSASQIADPFDRPQPLGEKIFDSFNRDTVLKYDVKPEGTDQADFEVGRDPLLDE
jgi:hypothetical protein